ncbi:hypothetical protein QQF64_023208 [Cirrhinus molitorella]|uniref:Uncharacterized protein n=1 Tax=Cirrhinus molitorella TaxID=172907 RepID=A0ABR3L4P1_9TELE
MTLTLRSLTDDTAAARNQQVDLKPQVDLQLRANMQRTPFSYLIKHTAPPGFDCYFHTKAEISCSSSETDAALQ